MLIFSCLACIESTFSHPWRACPGGVDDCVVAGAGGQRGWAMQSPAMAMSHSMAKQLILGPGKWCWPQLDRTLEHRPATASLITSGGSVSHSLHVGQADARPRTWLTFPDQYPICRCPVLQRPSSVDPLRGAVSWGQHGTVCGAKPYGDCVTPSLAHMQQQPRCHRSRYWGRPELLTVH